MKKLTTMQMAACGVLCLASSIAQSATFTDQAAFLSAIAGFANVVTETYGDNPTGDLGFSSGTLDFLTYNASAGGFNLAVTDFYYPGNNYLGVADGFDNSFWGGDSIDFGWLGASHAFGLWIHHEGAAQTGDLTLSFGGQNISLQAGPLAQTEYFLGIVDPTNTFSSASLTSTAALFTWNLDDITITGIPEPGTNLALLISGLLGFTAWRRRYSSTEGAERA